MCTQAHHACRVSEDKPNGLGSQAHLDCDAERLGNRRGAAVLRCNQLQAARGKETRKDAGTCSGSVEHQVMKRYIAMTPAATATVYARFCRSALPGQCTTSPAR